MYSKSTHSIGDLVAIYSSSLKKYILTTVVAISKHKFTRQQLVTVILDEKLAVFDSGWVTAYHVIEDYKCNV